MRALVVEDDYAIADAVIKRLKSENYAVDGCDNGRDAYDYMCITEYDIAIVDIMLPQEDGLSVVRRLRSEGVVTPVLFLTARDSVADRVAGLDAGGDDYLIKPFALDELMARIRVLIRRMSALSQTTNELILDDLRVDAAAQRVTRADHIISLTGREYSLLEYLMRHQGAILSREQIEQRLFSYEYEGSSNVVDVYIRYLRKSLNNDACKWE